MAVNIFDTVNELKNIARNTKEEKLSEADAVKAKSIVNFAEISNREDLFLFLSALNYLNSYVKKSYATPQFKNNYFFKNLVSNGIDAMITKNMDACSYCLENGALLINVAHLLFSFHYAQCSSLMAQARKEHNPKFVQQKWAGIRLQPIAASVFEKACALPNISPANIKLIESANAVKVIDNSPKTTAPKSNKKDGGRDF